MRGRGWPARAGLPRVREREGQLVLGFRKREREGWPARTGLLMVCSSYRERRIGIGEELVKASDRGWNGKRVATTTPGF